MKTSGLSCFQLKFQHDHTFTECFIVLLFHCHDEHYEGTVSYDTTRALQWSGNPYENGYGVDMDGNGAQLVKMLWTGLDLGKAINLKQ